MLIMVALFITLANLKQLIYQKRSWIYIKNIALVFSLLKTAFVLLYIKRLIINIVWTSINL